MRTLSRVLVATSAIGLISLSQAAPPQKPSVAAEVKTKKVSSSSSHLDLKPPKLAEIFSEAQINQMACIDESNMEEVSVEAVRQHAPPDASTIPSGWQVVSWLVTPRNVGAVPDSVLDAKMTQPTPYAGQMQRYDR
jgi:hypothetical protein